MLTLTYRCPSKRWPRKPNSVCNAPCCHWGQRWTTGQKIIGTQRHKEQTEMFWKSVASKMLPHSHRLAKKPKIKIGSTRSHLRKKQGRKKHYFSTSSFGAGTHRTWMEQVENNSSRVTDQSALRGLSVKHSRWCLFGRPFTGADPEPCDVVSRIYPKYFVFLQNASCTEESENAEQHLKPSNSWTERNLENTQPQKKHPANSQLKQAVPWQQRTQRQRQWRW